MCLVPMTPSSMEATSAEPSGNGLGRTTVLGALVLQDVAGNQGQAGISAVATWE